MESSTVFFIYFNLNTRTGANKATKLLHLKSKLG